MRKYIKDQLLSILASMEEAEKEIERLYKETLKESVETILMDLQQAAIAVGTEVEKSEGEGLEIVRFLEDYCELLWKCSQSKVIKDQLKYCKLLNETRIKVQWALKNDIKEQYDIVFMPYKASMWDSMESIWQAAYEDERCNCYVMPIPYFDKKSDGTIGEMHYEGKGLPEYVSTVDYRKFDLIQMHPDVIYIHNPYDDGNKITTVHPYYYAQKLKDYTDMLIYVPYFVLGEDIYEDFCVCAGTIYSDKVVVQSEKVRGVYIRCLKQFMKDMELQHVYTDKVIEDKILALGSPKIDKIVNDNRGRYILPKVWAELLKEKKAVLYNTGISGILNENERALKKIEDVIQCFRGREDVILWWRPHPLMESTCQTMRPELLKRYQEIVRNYKQEGFGIYDDTTELDRAVAYTDMYYGDDSSLIYLYGVQGKPIMMQNPYILLHDNVGEIDKTIYFNDCAYENGIMWFVAGNYNGLFQMNIESGETIYLGKIPSEDEVISNLYVKIFKQENNLWLIPNRAKDLVKYNLKDKTFEKYKFPGLYKEKMQRFQYACMQGNKIYMIPANYERIVFFNMETLTIHTDDKWLGYRDNCNICPLSVFPNICIVNGKLYFILYDTNVVVEYDLETRVSKEFKVGQESGRYADIVCDGTCFWLIPHRVGGVLCWNKEEGTTRLIEDYPDDFEHTSLFQTSYYKDGNLWLFPSWGNMVLKIDTKTMDIQKVNPKDEKYYSFFCKELEDGKIVSSFCAGKRNHILTIFNEEGECVREQKINEPMNYTYEVGDIFSHFRHADYETQKEYVIYESREINIEAVMSQITQLTVLENEQKSFLKLYNHANGTAGKEIMKAVMNACEGK